MVMQPFLVLFRVVDTFFHFSLKFDLGRCLGSLGGG